MPKVKCFQIPGIECWFWSNDHDPPHFHAKKTDEWEYRVNFTAAPGEMFDPVWVNRKPSGKLTRALRNLVARHTVELLQEWEENVVE